MTADGPREEMAAKLKAWECELERVRLALARAPDSIHDRHYSGFIEVYRAKETVRSRWEAVRGRYQAEPDAIRRLQDAFEAMEKVWAEAQPMFAAVLSQQGLIPQGSAGPR